MKLRRDALLLYHISSRNKKILNAFLEIVNGIKKSPYRAEYDMFKKLYKALNEVLVFITLIHLYSEQFGDLRYKDR